MTSPRFSALTLDLSRLPSPNAILGIDYDAIVAARIASLAARLTAAGIPFDTGMLRSEPSYYLQQEDAYRELIDLNAINDAVRAVMVAFAAGSDLDHLAAFYGLTRATLVPATGGAAAVLEADADFRVRVLMAPEAFAAAGSVGGYTFFALTADPANVRYADVWSPAAGEVMVAIQSRAASGVAPQSVVDTVHAYLHRDDIRPLTDVITVRAVEVLTYTIDVTCLILPGPDPAAVMAQVEASLLRMAGTRFAPTRDVPLSAVIAAATVGPVDKVIVHSPTTDLARARGQSARCIAINVKVEAYDG
jgi:phage-related baseplate assembly protein